MNMQNGLCSSKTHVTIYTKRLNKIQRCCCLVGFSAAVRALMGRPLGVLREEGPNWPPAFWTSGPSLTLPAGAAAHTGSKGGWHCSGPSLLRATPPCACHPGPSPNLPQTDPSVSKAWAPAASEGSLSERQGDGRDRSLSREEQGLRGRLDTRTWDLSLLPQDALTSVAVSSLP